MHWFQCVLNWCERCSCGANLIQYIPYQYRKSHYGDKKVVKSSYINNGNSYKSKTTYLYWIKPLGAGRDSKSVFTEGVHVFIITWTRGLDGMAIFTSIRWYLLFVCRFHIAMPSRNSHYKKQTVVTRSHSGYPYTWKRSVFIAWTL